MRLLIKLTLIIQLSFFLQSLNGQCGAGESVIIRTQSELDSFLHKYCIDFLGHLRIEDDNNRIDNITSLTSLTGLKRVDGILTIQLNNHLLNLTGLDSLQYTGAFRLSSNKSLKNLEGLSNLVETTGDFWLYNHPELEDINHLESLKTIGYGGALIISNLPKIQNIAGLKNLKIFSSISISNCDDLNDISALDESTILNYVQNSNNYDIVISDNQNLSDCSNPFLCKYISNLDLNINIENNSTNCNTINEVLTNCSVSTNEPKLIKKEIIYPNPTGGVFYIKNVIGKHLTIFNASGSLIMSRKIQTQNEQIRIEGNNGIYIGIIENYLFKIIKTK